MEGEPARWRGSPAKGCAGNTVDFKYPAFLVEKIRWNAVSLEQLQEFLDSVDNMPDWEVDLFLEWIEEGCDWLRCPLDGKLILS